MSPAPTGRLWVRLAILYAFLQIIMIQFMPDALSLQRAIAMIAPAGAAVFLFQAIRDYKSHYRNFWLMVGIGLMGDAAAKAVSALYIWGTAASDVRFLWADLFWGFEVMMFASAIIYLFRQAQGSLRGVRFMLDIVIVGITFMTVGWEYFIQPEIEGGPYGALWSAVWLDMLYLLCGIVLIFFTLVLYFHTRQLGKRTIFFLLLGGSAYMIGDALRIYLIHFVDAESGAYVELFHSLAVFCIAASGGNAALNTDLPPAGGRDSRPVGNLVVRYLLPYSVLGGMFGLMAQRFGGWNGLFTGLSLSVILILIRQIIIQIENDRLFERLSNSLSQSESLAHRDDLTGLYNRRYFNARLSVSLEEADRTGARVGLLYMDMNRFKKVNDRYGHRAGDLLIQKVARRLQKLESKGVLVSRLGGDEFVVMIDEAGEDYELIWMAEEIWTQLSEPYELDGHEVRTSPSIGIAVYPDHADDDQELIGRADAAMYAAKERHARWHFDVERTMLLQLLNQKIE